MSTIKTISDANDPCSLHFSFNTKNNEKFYKEDFFYSLFMS